MFKRFEKLTQAFPKYDPSQPPNTIFAFCRYYTRRFEKPLIMVALLSAVIAMIEVALFGFMGQLVDWLAASDPKTFLSENAGKLFGISLIILIVMPLLVLLSSLLSHQSLLGNYPMSIR